MRTGNRSNALLVELLIVIMFFMLASTVLLQVFTTARAKSEMAGRTVIGLNQAQDILDKLYAGGSAEEVLTQNGFSLQSERWERPDAQNRFTLYATVSSEDMPEGAIEYYEVIAEAEDGTAMASVKNARYKEAAR